MIERLLWALYARRLVGQIVGVRMAGEDTMIGITLEHAGLLGVRGQGLDGDMVVLPWRYIDFLSYGAACDRGFVRGRERIARHAESCPSCSDGRRDGSFSVDEIAAMLREPEGA